MKRPGWLIRGPIQPDRWTAMRFASLRWAALPVIDRRWTIPLSALALAFGIFVGIAIGPTTQGLGSQMQTVVEVVRPPSPSTTASTNTPGGGNNGGGGQNQPDPEPPSTPTPPADTGPFDTPSTPPPTPSPPTPPSTPSPPSTPDPPTPPTVPDIDDDDDQSGGDNTPSTTTVNGPVVHVNDFAGSYTVAKSGGKLFSVHAAQLPNVGTIVKVAARVLANGTWTEDGDRDHGDSVGSVDLAGTVTFSDPRIGAYTVSASGSSILVRVKAGVRMPQVGDAVELSARIADNLEPVEPVDPGRDGCGEPPRTSRAPKLTLEQTALTVTGGATRTDVEGIVQGVCRKSGSLILSADDLRASGRDIAIAVPNDLRLAQIEVGQVLKIRADVGSSGNLTATRIADDERASGADDESRIQP
jgi:hypothetical protein